VNISGGGTLKEIWKLEEWGRSFEDCFKWEVGSGNDISF